MRDGSVEQLGDAAALYERPRTRFASQFLGSCSLLEARVRQPCADGALVDTPIGELRVTGALPARENVTLAIRPEKVQLSPAPAHSSENRVRVRIEQLIYVGSETHYELRAGSQVLRAEVMNSHVGSQGFSLGQEALAYLPPGALIVLDD
jgi:ABC-type Fe3+/spermidine/putrescine transport system ATPase subunit